MSQPSVPANRLLHETSPYLKQHAHNPVDWYPWGPEAIRRARELDRPIFLSIGYSACHWCHVMERESFEDPEIADLLNRHFVSIKVDREERPDLDQIYMTFVQLATGHGGWPMTVFLTPDLQPFYGGTYFPPDDRYGGQLPSFRRLLEAIIDAWENRRDEVRASAANVTRQLQEALRQRPAPGELGPDLLQNAVRTLARLFDSRHGGFGRAPKFPHPMELRLLLRVWKRFGDDSALDMARLTFDQMARGGIYDHLGGGFHRYSTDERWLVPHFEKMLYDNAQLALAYLEGWQATGEPFYREVVEETLGYVLREMTSPEGPFYSAQDADSEGEEGKFYVWSAREVEEVLGKELADVFTYVYDVTPEGNWEGRNILHRSRTYAQDARMLGLPEEELRRKLAEARRKLFEVRSRRVWPGRDEKVLTAWNGLMISAFAQAAQGLDEPRYAQAAARAADFILTRMRGPDGRLRRTWSAGSPAKLNAYLEDYAFLIDALVSLYEADFNPRWVKEALVLADVMVEQFWDEDEGGFFFTGRDHEELIARTKEPQDNAIPSGNSMAVTGLLRLAALTGRDDLRDKAATTLRLYRGLLAGHPMAAGQMLAALDFYLGPVQEFAIVGDPDSEETRRVLRAVRSGFRPNRVVAFKPSTTTATGVEEVVPLLAGKTAADTVTTYVCERFACRVPLVGAAAAEAALAGAGPGSS
ncbi:MAG TPA: thioredoxin domain-containing protein [Gemmataceae bacterium]|nr:thioredoxin domain-containing protein [Gemmataceae bacterium]